MLKRNLCGQNSMGKNAMRLFLKMAAGLRFFLKSDDVMPVFFFVRNEEWLLKSR